VKKKKWFLLQEYVANRLKELDPYSRSTKGSGNCGEKGDVKNSVGLHIECKQSDKTTHMPVRVDWWKKLNEEIPLHVDKLPILCLKIKNGKKICSIRLR
jgi:hypothetical protein